MFRLSSKVDDPVLASRKIYDVFKKKIDVFFRTLCKVQREIFPM